MKNYRYFQMDKTCKDFDKKFYSPWTFLKSMDIRPDFTDYEEVYSGEVEGEDDYEICESLFKKFNINHPRDYKGRSMCVSDLIRIGDKYYYCDYYGFTEISF